MIEFKGFDDWVPIFRGGQQIDSNGRACDGDALIEAAIGNFNPGKYDPPIVIGHPVDNSPVYGWVSALKKIGDTLYAKFKNVSSEFEALVKKGFYKKRSASFFGNGTLRHVGFLGAMPPAVKGLADMMFNKGGESITFEFTKEKDPGGFLHQKTLELLERESGFSNYGENPKEHMTYSEAFIIIQKRYPGITQRYMETYRK